MCPVIEDEKGADTILPQEWKPETEALIKQSAVKLL